MILIQINNSPQCTINIDAEPPNKKKGFWKKLKEFLKKLIKKATRSLTGSL
jgi:predicted secreted protein